MVEHKCSTNYYWTTENCVKSEVSRSNQRLPGKIIGSREKTLKAEKIFKKVSSHVIQSLGMRESKHLRKIIGLCHMVTPTSTWLN